MEFNTIALSGQYPTITFSTPLGTLGAIPSCDATKEFFVVIHATFQVGNPTHNRHAPAFSLPVPSVVPRLADAALPLHVVPMTQTGILFLPHYHSHDAK